MTSVGDLPESPGPAEYDSRVVQKSPGGTIGKGKRMFLIDERETAVLPGPHNYQPKYRFVAKHNH